MADDLQRVVLLNWLTTSSSTRARSATPPVWSASDSFAVIENRFANNMVTEYITNRKNDGEDNDTNGFSRGNYVRVAGFERSASASFKYVTLLLRFVDVGVNAFAVEDIASKQSRDVSGGRMERGTTVSHVMVRMPLDESDLDIGRYRCVLESVAPLNRALVQYVINRQLRRYADDQNLSFTEVSQKRARSKPVLTEYRYTPKIGLNSSVGRAFSAASDERELSSMVFVKRHETQSIGDGGDVQEKEFLANVQYKVSANNGPIDSNEKKAWFSRIRKYFTSRGYASYVYYKHQNGDTIGGVVHSAVEGAFDIVMSPREILPLTKPVQASSTTINAEVRDGLKEILDRNELWECSK